jgi:hypothetical protein
MKKATVSAFFVISFFLTPGCEKTGIPGDSKSLENRQTLEASQCMKGILVKKGICGQRVIKITSQNKEGVGYAAQWKDEISGKTYENVFTVENYCSFPVSVNEGDEFTFKLTSDKTNDCVVCQSFTPVPGEKNSIIVNGDCGEKKN